MSSKKLFKVCKIIMLIVIAIVVIIALKNYKERKFLENERDRMSSYLTEKYKQEFEVGEVDKRYLGFGAGTDLVARCRDMNSIKLEISRYTTDNTYEDDYADQWIANELYSEVNEYVKELDEEADFYISCAYKGETKSFINKDIGNKDIDISIIIAIPEKHGFSKDEYIKKILEMLNKLYSENYFDFWVSIEFYDEAFKEDINKYFGLINGEYSKSSESISLEERNRLREVYDEAQFALFDYYKSDGEVEDIENLLNKWK